MSRAKMRTQSPESAARAGERVLCGAGSGGKRSASPISRAQKGGQRGMKTAAAGSRGFFLTLDVSIALLLTLTVTILALAYFGKPAGDGFEGALLYSYSQDAANVLSSRGCLREPLDAGRQAYLTCADEVLRATPDSYCAELSVYRVLSGNQTGVQYAEAPLLLYTVDKPGCTYLGGAVHSLSFPVAHNNGQAENHYYRAVLKAWLSGVRQ
jgi:hypothetical protein